MRIEELWQELEREALAGTTNSWLTRFALPQPSHPLLVGLETTSGRRALLLALPKAVLPSRHDWPVCRGLEIFTVAFAGQAHLGVRLRDASCADVFTSLAEDVAPRVAAAANPRAAAQMLLGRLRRWQKFLNAGVQGLSPEQQRGLYGELHTLLAHLLPVVQPAVAVAGWRAPLAAHQDFQYALGSIEVKTTTAKQPQAVRITSERQLDPTGIPALFLHVVVLDERVVEPGEAGGGCSLPQMVVAVRTRLAGETSALELFDDRLLETGYLAADAPRYESRRFTLRRELSYDARLGFPRLVEKDLMSGVGDVNYALALAACEPYAVKTEVMVENLIASPARPVSKRPRKK